LGLAVVYWAMAPCELIECTYALALVWVGMVKEVGVCLVKSDQEKDEKNEKALF
jgi:hypothetical protein